MVESSRFLEEITLEDVSSHIYELYTSPKDKSSRDLGITSKNQSVKVTIDNTDYEFEQSISQLNTTKSSTGFVLWNVSIPFVQWLIGSDIYELNRKYIVELGAGVTGIFSTIIGKLTSHYIATDQYPLLKLLKKNVLENNEGFQSQTIDIISGNRNKSKNGKRDPLRKLDVVTYDWENCENDIALIRRLNDNEPDFIIGCDIVYNDYLVPFLVDAIEKLAGPHTTVLIGLQLRLPDNIELFVEELLNRRFKVFRHEESVLTEELKEGYVVYYIKKKE